MDISEVISIALPIVYVLVGAALIWLVIELVMTVRRTRKTVEEVQKQVEPTLASVERITASLEPVAAKVDPLVERVSLTVDAANLEIMRVDQILEDVNEITDSVSSAVDAGRHGHERPDGAGEQRDEPRAQRVQAETCERRVRGARPGENRPPTRRCGDAVKSPSTPVVKGTCQLGRGRGRPWPTSASTWPSSVRSARRRPPPSAPPPRRRPRPPRA